MVFHNWPARCYDGSKRNARVEIEHKFSIKRLCISPCSRSYSDSGSARTVRKHKTSSCIPRTRMHINCIHFFTIAPTTNHSSLHPTRFYIMQIRQAAFNSLHSHRNTLKLARSILINPRSLQVYLVYKSSTLR